MESKKRLLILSDLPAFGRVALAAAFPGVEALGVQACALPTALLSTHGGYPGAVCYPQTEFLEKSLGHLGSLGVTFHGVLLGFVAQTSQFTLLETLAKDQRSQGRLVVVDPILGDNGRLYGLFSKDYLPGMRSLVSLADVITPNLTEAAFLLDQSYEQLTVKNTEYSQIARDLAHMGPGLVVITSLPDPEDPTRLGYGAYSRSEGEFLVRSYPRLDINFPGTGDFFTALFTAHLVLGKNWKDALALAGDQTYQAICGSLIPGRDPREGLAF